MANTKLTLGGRTGGKSFIKSAMLSHMRGLYILDGKKPVNVTDLVEWSRWCHANETLRQVDKTVVCADPRNPVGVSTVFLTIDHRVCDGPPLLFETMVFGGDRNGYVRRCSTWEQAETQHAQVVAMLVPYVAKIERLDE